MITSMVGAFTPGQLSTFKMADEISASSSLSMMAEKVVQPAINPKHLAYCPTMDLVAFATVDGQVHVHRLNGQRVFGASGKQSTGNIRDIKWKPNGRRQKSDRSVCREMH